MRVLCIAIVGAVLAACGGSNVGAACSATQPCASPLLCAATETPGVTVCMRPCEIRTLDAGVGADTGPGVEARLCSDGTLCADDGARVCYLGGRTPYLDTCMTSIECEAGTTCSPDVHQCEQACTVGDDRPCRTTETCTDIAGGICRPDVGGACSDTRECAAGLVCAASSRPNERVCMRPCDDPAARLCNDFRACLDVGGMQLCYVGGSVGVDGGCMTTYDCAPGLLCAPDAMLCQKPCVIGQEATTCTGQWMCADVAGGVCRPRP